MAASPLSTTMFTTTHLSMPKKLRISSPMARGAGRNRLIHTLETQNARLQASGGPSRQILGPAPRIPWSLFGPNRRVFV